MASVAKHPKRNIHLRHGARIIERHDGAPPPPPLVERDPDLKSWSAHLIWGKKMQLLATFRRKIRECSSAISMTGAPRNCTNGRILP
jgi:hypothetical protein